jgi:hypothetical protein
MSEFEKQMEQIAADTRELTNVMEKSRRAHLRGEGTDDLMREAESLTNVIAAKILDVCLVHIVKNIEVTNGSATAIAAAFLAASRLVLNVTDEAIRDDVEQLCESIADRMLDIAEGREAAE